MVCAVLVLFACVVSIEQIVFFLAALSHVKLSTQSRLLLMAKLQRSDAPASAAGAKVAPAVSVVPVDTDKPSCCVLLQNMFDPYEEQAGFENELEEEIKSEAGKLGRVVHIKVDPQSAGFVYVKFARIPDASRALNSFRGRWFGGREVMAQYVSEAHYYLRYPEAMAL
jgi:RNA-binding protein 39